MWGIYSLLLPCGFQELNSRHQPWSKCLYPLAHKNSFFSLHVHIYTIVIHTYIWYIFMVIYVTHIYIYMYMGQYFTVYSWWTWNLLYRSLIHRDPPAPASPVLWIKVWTTSTLQLAYVFLDIMNSVALNILIYSFIFLVFFSQVTFIFTRWYLSSFLKLFCWINPLKLAVLGLVRYLLPATTPKSLSLNPRTDKEEVGFWISHAPCGI